MNQLTIEVSYSFHGMTIPGVVIPEHFANEEFTKKSLHSESEQPEKQVKQKPR